MRVFLNELGQNKGGDFVGHPEVKICNRIKKMVDLLLLIHNFFANDEVIGSSQCLCLPKAELNTKNSTKRQLCCRLVEFLVFNSIGQLISLPSDEVYRVGTVVRTTPLCFK